MRKRITNANSAYYAVLPLLKSQSVFRAEKIKIHKTSGNVPYVAASWTMNKDTAKRLAALEGKVLRRMFGGIKVNENCRQRYKKN